MKTLVNNNPTSCGGRRQEARLNSGFSRRNAELAFRVRASSRMLLLRLLLMVSGSCGLSSVQAQTNCTECWKKVTHWRGNYTMTLTGTGPWQNCGSFQLNDSSSGSFELSNRVSTVSGSGSISSVAICSCSPGQMNMSDVGTGPLHNDGGINIRLNTTNCTYVLSLIDVIDTVVTTTDCNGANIFQMNVPKLASGFLATPADLGAGVLPDIPLPAFGAPLTGSGTYAATKQSSVEFAPMGQFTLTLSWYIEPVIDQSPPQFTQVPTGVPLGCNPINLPDASQVLAGTAATAASGEVSIGADYADTTNGCTVTRSFTLTATDTCTGKETRAVVAYWWTADTTPPVITTVPAGSNLGCNPTNLPTDVSVQAQVLAVDNCGSPTINVTHADSTSGCMVTRTFSITASDSCGNVSPARTTVYSWTTDTEPPTFLQLPPGGFLGSNPPTVPDDAAVRAKTQATDNCGLASIAVTHTDGGVAPSHSRTFTITATDNCGNQATASWTYTWTGNAGGGPGTGSSPILGILRSGTNVVLYWPTNVTGFTLQTRTNLAPTNAWNPVTNAPTVVNDQFMVTNTATGAGRFYRLMK